MKIFWIQFVVLVLIIIGASYFVFNPGLLSDYIPIATSTPQRDGTKIKINNTIVDVEVADTLEERKRGLGGRDSLPANSGMLFIFNEEKKHQFWMKGMKIPLDFIFISNGRVVDLLGDVPPPQPNQKDSDLPIYQPAVPVNMMLEVNSGFARQHNIKPGDTVYLIRPQ